MLKFISKSIADKIAAWKIPKNIFFFELLNLCFIGALKQVENDIKMKYILAFHILVLYSKKKS